MRITTTDRQEALAVAPALLAVVFVAAAAATLTEVRLRGHALLEVLLLKMKRRQAVRGNVLLANSGVEVSIAVGGSKASPALSRRTKSIHSRRDVLAGILKERRRALRAVEVATSTEGTACHVETRRIQIMLLVGLEVV